MSILSEASLSHSSMADLEEAAADDRNAGALPSSRAFPFPDFDPRPAAE